MASKSFFRRHPVLTVFLLLVLLGAGAAVYFFRTTSREELVKQGKNYVMPDLQSAKTVIDEITADSVKGKIIMRVKNSLPLTIDIDSLQYKVTLDGDTVTKGYDDSGIRIEANSNDEVTVPVKVNIRSFYKKVEQLESDSADVGVHAVLYNHFPVVGSKAIPVNFTKKIYIPRLPEVEVEGVDLSDLGLQGGKLQVKIKVTNYSAMPYSVNGFTYRFTMSDNIDLKGKSDQNFNFNKKGSEIITIPVDVDLKQVGEAAIKILFKSEDTPYTLAGNMHIVTNSAALGKFDMAFQNSGTIKELKENVKAATKNAK
jgi:LEA14-like dessication related protein